MSGADTGQRTPDEPGAAEQGAAEREDAAERGAAAPATWLPPSPVAPRGTLLVLPGRGEHPLVYERFGVRLAADGYVVHALGTPPGATPAQVARAAEDAAGPEPARPVVLVGSDTGALQALHALHAAGAPGAGRGTDAGTPTRGAPEGPDGAVLAGSASAAPPPPDGPRAASEPELAAWERELDTRTACPAHRARLTGDAGFTRGALRDPVPGHLRDPVGTTVPVLVVHGAADPVTPLAEARALAARLPAATLGVVRGGLHDVLNDATHRTTAAALVLWLERLREGPGAAPLLTLEPGTGEGEGAADEPGRSRTAAPHALRREPA